MGIDPPDPPSAPLDLPPAAPPSLPLLSRTSEVAALGAAMLVPPAEVAVSDPPLPAVTPSEISAAPPPEPQTKLAPPNQCFAIPDSGFELGAVTGEVLSLSRSAISGTRRTNVNWLKLFQLGLALSVGQSYRDAPSPMSFPMTKTDYASISTLVGLL